MSICLLQTIYSHAIDFCKLFLRCSKLTHALLPSKIIIKIYLSENKEVTLLMQLNW